MNCVKPYLLYDSAFLVKNKAKFLFPKSSTSLNQILIFYLKIKNAPLKKVHCIVSSCY